MNKIKCTIIILLLLLLLNPLVSYTESEKGLNLFDLNTALKLVIYYNDSDKFNAKIEGEYKQHLEDIKKEHKYYYEQLGLEYDKALPDRKYIGIIENAECDIKSLKDTRADLVHMFVELIRQDPRIPMYFPFQDEKKYKKLIRSQEIE